MFNVILTDLENDMSADSVVFFFPPRYCPKIPLLTQLSKDSAHKCACSIVVKEKNNRKGVYLRPSVGARGV